MPATQPGHWFRPVTKPGKINNKKRGFLFLKKFNFCGFIHWPQSQEYYCTFWVTQYLSTPELEIFVGEYSLTLESRIL
jgi:hypothetical protein